MNKSLTIETTNSINLIEIKLSTICNAFNLTYHGDDCIINGLNLSNRALQGDNNLSYCASAKYLKYAFANDKIKAILVAPEIFDSLSEQEKRLFTFVLTETPEATFYRIFIWLSSNYYPRYEWQTNTNNATVGTGSIIEPGVIMGANVIIGYNSVVKSGTIIGDNVIIGNCCVIGNDGFQLIKTERGINMNIPHVGRTIIGNNVSIGDNATVSKSLFDGFTSIGDNTKIDNHVHVAHNCKVGNNCVLTAGSLMFGSSELKDNVWLAPHSSVMNRTIVGENAFVGASSFVTNNVKPGAIVFGVPSMPMSEFTRREIAIRKLVKKS